MATSTIVDYRRPDLRSNVLENPYWISSGEFGVEADSKAALLFSFPKGNDEGHPNPSAVYGDKLILIHEIVLEVITAFTSDSTTFTIGQGSIVTDDITTGGVSTDGAEAATSPDDYMVKADGDADILVAGYHTIDTSCVFLTAKAAATWGAIASITPVNDTVLCIQAYLIGGTLLVGSARVHALISIVPGSYAS